MNTFFRHAAIAATAAIAAAASPAFAQEATFEPAQPVVVVKSRAEVRAEVLRSTADGTLLTLSTTEGGERVPHHASLGVGRDRESVRREAVAAVRNGTLSFGEI